MKIIGLTGGIGSGKTTVSKYLTSRGFHVIDADIIAREIVENTPELLEKLALEFGSQILFEDGTLNRKKMGSIAFSDAEEKAKLDEIMHKEIIIRINQRLYEIENGENPKAVFVDAALLFETELHNGMDATWVVDSQDHIRIKRVIARDGLSKEEVEDRIKNQMPRHIKNKMADEIIDNSTQIDELYQQVERLLNKFN